MKAVAPKAASQRTDTINIRVHPRERNLIDEAASMLGKTRSDFMLDASRREAEETLLDRTLFRLDTETYDRFLAMLDAPPNPSPALVKLMRTKAPWE